MARAQVLLDCVHLDGGGGGFFAPAADAPVGFCGPLDGLLVAFGGAACHLLGDLPLGGLGLLSVALSGAGRLLGLLPAGLGPVPLDRGSPLGHLAPGLGPPPGRSAFASALALRGPLPPGLGDFGIGFSFSHDVTLSRQGRILKKKLIFCTFYTFFKLAIFKNSIKFLCYELKVIRTKYSISFQKQMNNI